MRRKTWWVLLAIMIPILAMMALPTSQARRSTGGERIKKSMLAMKQAAARRDAAQGQQKRGALAPTRPRTPEELARIALKAPKTYRERLYKEMSPMGALAAKVLPDMSKREEGRATPSSRGEILEAARKALAKARSEQPQDTQDTEVIGTKDIIVNGPDDFGLGPTDLGNQTETTIDSNAAGTVLVAGYNDFKGFFVVDANGNFSISGVARSTDGGATWNEVTTDPDLPGLLPVGNGDGLIFGDPDVKWSPKLNGGQGGFIYSSIFLRNSDGVEGMCVNISDPNGANWSDPIQVPPTFRPGPAPGPIDDDIADKEFIDVNLVTGRILMSWTNFPAFGPEPDAPNSPAQGAIQILTTFNDNGGMTWSTAQIVGENTADPAGGVQSSVPRFLPGTTNANSQAYVAFRIGNSDGTVNIAVNRSTNGGATWLANGVPIDTAYPGPDQIPGNDRVNNSPSMDIDYDTGKVYVVYQRNNATGQGDIALRSFIGAPVADTPLLINSSPGNDRTQWFPDISVDQDTSFVNVNFLDQDSRPSGDVTEEMNTYSEDEGASFSPPTPINDQPFHAGYGNDSSEPNMGDYNQNVSLAGRILSIWGGTSVQPLFNECLDGGLPLMCTPDAYFDQRLESDEVIPVRTNNQTFVEVGGCRRNGFFDPRETANFTIPLENYDTNPDAEATTLTGITARLTTTTGGVIIINGTSPYPNIAPGATKNNADPFVVQLTPAFVPGTFINFVLTVDSDQGHTQLQFRSETGTPGKTTVLIKENFNSAPAPNLPPGWTSVVGSAPMDDPWIVSDARTPGNPAAFHDNDGTNSEWIRLRSPIVTIPVPPAGVQSYVTVDFDLNYSLEEDPSALYQAFDGLFLRLTRFSSSGVVLRSVLAEAFAERITTDGIEHYPKHLPRSNDPDYFADMSVWSGNSIDLDNNGDGTIHVSMKFPGTGLVGNKVQQRFEYTEDSNSNCLLSGGDAPCGIAVDNVVMKQVQLKNGGPTTGADLSIDKSDDPDPVLAGENVTYHLVVTNHGPDTATGVVVTDKLSSSSTYISSTSSQGSCAHSGGIPNGIVTCNLGSMANGATATVDIVVRTHAPPPPDTAVNTASVKSNVCDLDLSNNKDTETTTLIGLSNLTLSPSTVTGGCQDSTGTLTLTRPAPPGGLVVNLHSNNPFVHVPATVTVNEGETSANFTAETDVVTAEQVATITAIAGSNRVSSMLHVLPVTITSLTFDPNPVHGGQDSIATITLSCAPDQPITVRLTSDRAAAMPESPITIPAGSSSGQATIHTAHVDSTRNVTITASANGGYKRGTLTIIP